MTIRTHIGHRFLILILLLCSSLHITAQQLNPSHWKYSVEEVTTTSAVLRFDVTLDAGWHIYSNYTADGGPLPTEFQFNPSDKYSLAGKIIEPKPIKEFDDAFGVEVSYFSNATTFRQRIERNSTESFEVSGTISFQLCNNGSCIAPDDKPFSFSIPASDVKTIDASAVSNDKTAIESEITNEKDTSVAAISTQNEIRPASDNEKEEKQQSWIMVFLIALLGGLLTMITPCVFPMVPMTVNYFVHNGKRNQAWVFGFSIILIFAVLGALLTLVFGPESLYFLGTHWIPNLIFFVIFLTFSLSFFGLFEITLPEKWINKSDQQTDRGGWMAPFFMALTTVLVSFSCTGPILGAALVGLATSTTNAWVSLLTMLGFGIGFALPFTLLALFPSWLKGLKSGAWLGSVKVTFAFLELAFGLKFLSMADLYCGWHILDREVYLALWIVIFALLGLYLLGKIRFKGEEPLQHIGVIRLFLVIIDFAFVVYMIPGLWGAPLKAISGFLPPMSTQDFNMEASNHHQSDDTDSTAQYYSQRKYADKLHLPSGFNGFFDLDEAMEAARQQNKPIFIDFTGKTCANCREMEHYVWDDDAVKKILNEQYIICALFVDENTIELPESEWITTPEGRTLKTLGRRNLHIEKTRYNMNAQPYYVLIDADGKTLTPKNFQYNRNPRHFEEWLRQGLAAFALQ